MEGNVKKSTVYTRTGDKGMTSLVGGERVKKNSCRVEAYGTIDELNAHIGLLMAECRPIDGSVCEMLTEISITLFDIGSYLASLQSAGGAVLEAPAKEHVDKIEREIDRMDAQLDPMYSFLLPCGHHAAAQAHVARTVCRRAERRILDAVDEGFTVDATVTEWVNRLSDYLFILSRYINHITGSPEIPWQKR